MSTVGTVQPRSAVMVIDGTEHKVLFDLNAMAELEDNYGSVEEAFVALDNGSFKAIRKVLWIGLLHHNENITEREVGRMISLANLATASKSLISAIAESMPDIKPEDVNIPN